MAFRSGALTNFTTTTTPVANMPAGVVAHDRLLAFVSQDGASSVPTAPSGWTGTAIANTFQNTPDSQAYYIFEKKDASGSEGSTQTFGTSNTSAGQILIIALSGRDNSAAATVSSPTQDTTGSTTTPKTLTLSNSVTATSGDDIVVFVGMDQVTSGDVITFGSWSSSLTERLEGSTSFCSSGAATRDGVSAGAFGTVTVSATNSGSGTTGFTGYVIAVPAGAAPPSSTSDLLLLLI